MNEEKFILTPNAFTREEWCDMYKKVIELCQQKENIIKEVREYIEEKEKNDDNWIDYELCIEPIVIKEMLDKESEVN